VHLYSTRKVKPILSQNLEGGVFIYYCAAASEYEIVKRVKFGWPFCGKNDWRLIFGKVCYGIIPDLFFKRLIQNKKHKCSFHDQFSKFLFTAMYEFETRTATRSA